MRISIKHAIAAALAVSAGLAATANAATIVEAQPGTGNSDLLFFVSDQTNHTTYTRSLNGTGNGSAETVGGLFNIALAAPGTSGAVTPYTADSSFSIDVAADSALTTFISNANSAGDTLEYGVIAGAYTPGAYPTANVSGGAVGLATTSNGAATINTFTDALLTGHVLGSTTNGLGADIANLDSKTADAYNATTTGVLGTSSSKTPNALTFYTAGVAMANLAIGTASELYAVTPSGPSGSLTDNYDLGSILFDGTNLTFTANQGSPVPLPAGILLFGSGLLGLAGIGRRKSAGISAGVAAA